jgi:hypothetical protein
MGRGYNGMKRHVLHVYVRSGWLTVPELAAAARSWPVRRMYTVLLRYWRWGLLDRRLNRRGLIEYRISDRGQTRLAWLTKPDWKRRA